MIKINSLTAPKVTTQMVDSFGGYNAAVRIPEGEWNDMQNMSSDHWPMLATRKKRGMMFVAGNTTALMAKDKLVRISNDRLFHGGEDLSEYFDAMGYSLTPGRKNLVSMGAYIVIFPDKLFINTANPSDCGSLEAYYTQGAAQPLSYAPCDKEGELLEPITFTINGVEPPDEGEQRYWLDMGKLGTTPVLKELMNSKDEDGNEIQKWVAVPEAYLRLSCLGIGEKFNAGDCVSITGASTENPSAQPVLTRLNGKNYRLIVAAERDFIAVEAELVWASQTDDDLVSVSRETPDMDFVIEADNRLWGCKYGQVRRDFLNEIYCCKLGDFRNWRCYQGISTDSYTASCGTDGPFTGAITYQGHPLFFKENALHKVYISPTGAHQIVSTAIRGVQEGSSGSLAVVNEILYYKSVDGICAYDGSVPTSVGDKLGQTRYKDAVAGAFNSKYYISMIGEGGYTHLFVYDVKKGIWHREDSTRVISFAAYNGDLYALEGAGLLWTAFGSEGNEEPELNWSATSGVIGYSIANKKYISRLNLRMYLPRGSTCNFWIQYDSNGIWKHRGCMKGNGLSSFIFPIVPQRCDHFRIRLEGKGEFKLFSISKIIEVGSDM